MVKADLHLTEDPATGKVVVPAGFSFADLMGVWRHQHALVARLFDRYDSGDSSAIESEHFREEEDYCQLVEQAIWERPVECIDDLRMLAELAVTYQDETEVLASAVLKILGRAEMSTPPAALFAPPSTPRVGLTIGR